MTSTGGAPATWDDSAPGVDGPSGCGLKPADRNARSPWGLRSAGQEAAPSLHGMTHHSPVQGAAWAAYRAAQGARRHVRRRRRLERLWRKLPPRGVEIGWVGKTGLRLRGYGFEVFWDPTHAVARLPGESTNAMMTPEQVAAEFRWRWKREGCP